MSSPTDKICGEKSKLFLQVDGSSRADFEVVHLEYMFAFFDASFNNLACVVLVKPFKQIIGNWMATEVN